MSEYFYTSPIGVLVIGVEGNSLSRLDFSPAMSAPKTKAQGYVAKVVEQLDAYFAGNLHDFSLSLAPQGTEFQCNVWNALQEIPYATTASYKHIAERIGNPAAVRAVGQANNRNPIAIIVPCHRVVGANNSLTGYAGGLDKKEWLLAHEAVHGFVRHAA